MKPEVQETVVEDMRWETRRIPILKLDLGYRAVHAGSDGEIKRMRQSIKNNKGYGGILNYPLVRASDLRVLDGHDRIEAAILEGRQHAECRLIECDDDEAEQIAIDANLVRKSLSPADYDDLCWRAKLLYLKQNPQTGNGGRRAGAGRPRQKDPQKSDGDDNNLISDRSEPAYYTYAAERLAVSTSTVQAWLRRGKYIDRESREILDRAGLAPGEITQICSAVVAELPQGKARAALKALPPVEAELEESEMARAITRPIAEGVQKEGRKAFEAWLEEHPSAPSYAERLARSTDRRSYVPKAVARPTGAPGPGSPLKPTDASAKDDASLSGYGPEAMNTRRAVNATNSTARDRAPTRRIACDPRSAAHEILAYLRYEGEIEALIGFILEEWKPGPLVLAGILAHSLSPDARRELARLLDPHPENPGNGHHKGPIRHSESRR